MNRPTLRLNSRGEDVKYLQKLLKITADGIFGPATQRAVKAFQQADESLTVDGIVGPKTWNALERANSTIVTEPELYVNHYLPTGQYIAGNYRKDLIVLHHTAGWNDPFQVITSWKSDSLGRVATEMVVGGQRVTNSDATYDGVIVHAFPTGGYAGHIGKCGVPNNGLDKRSVGIELCDFGHITIDPKTGVGKTYTGAVAAPEQIVKLDKKFRGYDHYHRYSDKELESLRKLLLFIADRDNIDLHDGLYQWIKKYGVDAFEFQSDAYYGKTKGICTHANVRRDKEDVFPQQELIDLILSL